MITGMAEEWDASTLQEHWCKFSTKVRLLAELESVTSKNLRTYLKQKSERDSIPPESAAEIISCSYSTNYIHMLALSFSCCNLKWEFKNDYINNLCTCVSAALYIPFQSFR